MNRLKGDSVITGAERRPRRAGGERVYAVETDLSFVKTALILRVSSRTPCREQTNK